MAEWELGEVFCKLRKSETATWVDAPATWSIDYHAPLFLRMGFNIVNGDEEIATGNLYLQVRRDGGAWEDHPAHYGRDREPGYSTGGEFGEVYPPDWVDRTIEHDAEDAGTVIEYRTRLDWTTFGFSNDHEVSVTGEQRKTMAELEPRVIRGEFESRAVA